MARTVASLPAGGRITDYISLGVVAKTFPLDKIRAALAATERESTRERESAGGANAFFPIGIGRCAGLRELPRYAWTTQSARAAGSGYRRHEQLVSVGGRLPTAVPATAAGGHPGLRPTDEEAEHPQRQRDEQDDPQGVHGKTEPTEHGQDQQKHYQCNPSSAGGQICASPALARG